MAWTEIRIGNWAELVGHFDSMDNEAPSLMPYLFRGQSDTDWPLVDSISRLLESLSSASDPRRAEQLAYRNFRSQAHLLLDPSSLPAEKSLLAWWALMQHFGCPTRLLDWTFSGLVATYFAVSENWERPGAVWVFDQRELLTQITGPEIEKIRDAIKATQDTVDIFWAPFPILFIQPFSLTRHHHAVPYAARCVYSLRQTLNGPWFCD